MRVKIIPTRRLQGVVEPPPSKNYTTRCLLAAALAEGESIIRRPAESEDASALKRCLAALGAELIPDGPDLRVRGFGRRPKNPGVLDVGNAGTVLRLLLGVGALLPEVTFVNSYPESLGKRPNQDLLDALTSLGVECRAEAGGRLPITLRGGDRLNQMPPGGRIEVSGEKSSQYLSSLLFLAPLLDRDVEIRVGGSLKSKPLIRQTLEVLSSVGIKVEAAKDLSSFQVAGGQAYQPNEHTVPVDYPAVAALLSAAAIVQSDVTFTGLLPDAQGERAILDVLAQMGADIEHFGPLVRIRGGRPLRGIEFDGDQAIDAIPAMVAVACLAEGQSRFYNVENLRYKECDRITDYRTELNKAGFSVHETQSEILVEGSPNGAIGDVEVDSHFDHRVIMGLTIVGLRTRKGLIINEAQHVAKSYPGFFDQMRLMGAKIAEI